MNQVVAITGINGGIGKALCLEFQRRGHEVIGLDLSEKCDLSVDYFQVDVTQSDQAQKLYDDISKKYQVKIWINNAGIAVLGPFNEVSAQDFQRVMDVNFNAVVVATRFWLPRLEENAGIVVNMSSAAGFIPSGDMSSYVASKHALIGFTRAIQLELDFNQAKASTCLVTPGFVKTDIMKVGTKYGLPEKLQKYATTPENCAKEIVEAVLNGEREVIPTLSGKLMTGLYRYLPFGADLARSAYKKSRQIKE